MSYIDRLIVNCNKAKGAAPVREFQFEQLDDLAEIKKAIYIIEEVGGDVEKTFIEFSRYKDRKERKCARLNAPSRVMYVGSSTTGLKKRIEDHLGQGNKGTYALHLNQWFTGKYRITVKEYDVERDVLQIVEDDLSDRLRPAFGKQGGNNK
jgi:hypothetical protein